METRKRSDRNLTITLYRTLQLPRSTGSKIDVFVKLQEQNVLHTWHGDTNWERKGAQMSGVEIGCWLTESTSSELPASLISQISTLRKFALRLCGRFAHLARRRKHCGGYNRLLTSGYSWMKRRKARPFQECRCQNINYLVCCQPWLVMTLSAHTLFASLQVRCRKASVRGDCARQWRGKCAAQCDVWTR